jgi:hypothetical protein
MTAHSLRTPPEEKIPAEKCGGENAGDRPCQVAGNCVYLLNTVAENKAEPDEESGYVLTTLLFAFSAFPRDHTALNGNWTLAPPKSDFAGQPVIQTDQRPAADIHAVAG